MARKKIDKLKEITTLGELELEFPEHPISLKDKQLDFYIKSIEVLNKQKELLKLQSDLIEQQIDLIKDSIIELNNN